jgi:hypothetical protein
MCNRYGNQNPLSRIIAEFSDLAPINWDKLERNAPLDQIRPTDRAPTLVSTFPTVTRENVFLSSNPDLPR